MQVLTTNEDGSQRDTKVWLVVADGQGYIRTGNTRWGGNVVRDPDVTLRIEGSDHALRVEFVEDEDQRDHEQLEHAPGCGQGDQPQARDQERWQQVLGHQVHQGPCAAAQPFGEGDPGHLQVVGVRQRVAVVAEAERGVCRQGRARRGQ